MGNVSQMESFGAYLKSHREKKGIRLEEIASITKIHIHALELLEANKLEQLPPEPFIRGFIIAYAKYVGMPTAEVLEKYGEATGKTKPPAATVNADGSTTPSPVSMPSRMVGTPPSEIITQVRLPSAPKIITAASLLAVVGLAALLINVGRDAGDGTAVPTQVTMTPETPATQIAAPAPSDDRKVALSTDPAKAPAVSPTPPPPVLDPNTPVAHEVVVEGKERTWIKVVIDENPPNEYFLAEGKAVSYRAANKIKVVLGNSTGSRVLYNGQETDGKQFMGTIKSYKFPPDARFPQDVPSKRTPSTNIQEAEGMAPQAQ